MTKKIVVVIAIGSLLFSSGCSGTTGSKRKISDTKPVAGDRGLSTKSAEILSPQMSNQEIQIALKNAGYYEGNIDGILGSRSRDAIRRFQQDHGLKDDSIAGPMTRDKLIKYIDTGNKP